MNPSPPLSNAGMHINTNYSSEEDLNEKYLKGDSIMKNSKEILKNTNTNLGIINSLGRNDEK